MTRDEEIRRDEVEDHHRARRRGLRLLQMANDIASALHGSGVLSDTRTTRRVTFHVLADHLYGNLAIDIPLELDRP